MRPRLLLLPILGLFVFAALGADSCGDSSSGSTATLTSPASETTGAATTEQRVAKTVDSATASGDYAIAQASGSVDEPGRIRVLVNATPNQKVMVTWTMVCTQKSGAGSSDDQFNATTPVDRTLKLPAKDASGCIVSANAQLDGSGTVKVRIRG